MLADTAAIHAFSAASARHVADLEEIASFLAAARTSIGGEALGPVGAGFVEALRLALSVEARTLARIGERVAATATAAHTSAGAYESTDDDTGRSIAGVAW